MQIESQIIEVKSDFQFHKQKHGVSADSMPVMYRLISTVTCLVQELGEGNGVYRLDNVHAVHIKAGDAWEILVRSYQG